MTKKIKRIIKRICIGTVLLIAGVIVTGFFGEWAGLCVYAAAYAVIAYDVVGSAFVNIFHGQVFDEKFLMMLATVGAFFCREYTEAVLCLITLPL